MIIGLILVSITVNINIEAMAYSLLITSVTSQVINSWPNRKLLKYNYLNQIRDILPNILLAVFMGAIVYLVNFMGFNSIITLIIQVPLGIVVYIVGSILTKNDSFLYLMEFVKSIMKKIKKN